MRVATGRAIVAGAVLAALFPGATAWADVKAGVDAWSRGDYAAAVHEWQGPADAGDPDAMFNLGQAYRLGRGVPRDPAKAEQLYARAAAKGHLGAADTYGLMLFQDGRREAALPYLQDAAKRGDPRAQYLLGIASFNGDLVPKDWVKAYALVTLANQHNLPQAASALAQMDQFIPLEQRQRAAGLAVQLGDEANAERGRALAAADLAAGVGAPAPARAAAASPRVPHALATVAVSPSVAQAREALAEARAATGTESPARAGASFAGHPLTTSHVAAATASAKPKPVAVATSHPAAQATSQPEPTASSKPQSAAVAKADKGPWRVQLGAFAVPGNADKLWAQLGGESVLADKSELKIVVGKITKLQASGYATRAQADDACRVLKRRGHDCIVTR
jgi:cell division septation protein DedD